MDMKSEYLGRAQQFQQQKSEKTVKRLSATVEPFSHCSTTQERLARTTLSPKNDVISPLNAITPKHSPSVSGSMVSPVQKDTMTVDRNPPTHSNMFADSLSSPHLLPPMNLYHTSRNELDEDKQYMSSTPINREVATCDRLSAYPESSGLLKSSELESKILVQADVNKELKRLLVASIGSDLQHRLNQIAQEKAIASHDLHVSLQQLTENEEEIDRLSIKCDIWRSKFLASRLMIDELAAWKAAVSQQLRESQRALQLLLKEHVEMKRVVVQFSNHLDEIGCFGKDISRSSNHQDKTVLDISETFSSRAKMLRELTSLKESVRNSIKRVGTASGEILAVQVLSNGNSPCSVFASQIIPLPLRLNKEQSSQQKKVKSKLSSLPLSHSVKSKLSSLPLSHSSFPYILGTESHFHCNRCKGEIHHI